MATGANDGILDAGSSERSRTCLAMAKFNQWGHFTYTTAPAILLVIAPTLRFVLLSRGLGPLERAKLETERRADMKVLSLSSKSTSTLRACRLSWGCFRLALARGSFHVLADSPIAQYSAAGHRGGVPIYGDAVFGKENACCRHAAASGLLTNVVSAAASSFGVRYVVAIRGKNIPNQLNRCLNHVCCARCSIERFV